MRSLAAATAVIAIGAIGAISVEARANDAAVRKALVAQYAAMNRGAKSKDLNMMLKPLAPELMVTLPGGKTVNRAQTVVMLKQELAVVSSVQQSTTRIDKLSVKGNTAVAMVAEQVVGTVATPDGKTHKLNDSTSSRDTWIRTSSGWLMKSSVTLSEHATLDGKPVPTGGAGAG